MPTVHGGGDLYIILKDFDNLKKQVERQIGL